MNYKLIASDIDGTLLDENGNLSEKNSSSIKRLVASGNFFVLSTGRPIQAISPLITRLTLENTPIIAYNGARVTCGNETLFNLTLGSGLYKEIVAEGVKRNATMVCWSEDKLYAESLCDRVNEYKKIGGVEPIICKDLSLVDRVTKLVWIDEPETVSRYHAEMTALFGKRANVHPTRINFLEFVNKDCSKAIALKIVCDALKVRVSESIAVGDGINDISMIRAAGLGVAVENAGEEVKKNADYIAPHCNKNAINHLIGRFFGL